MSDPTLRLAKAMSGTWTAVMPRYTQPRWWQFRKKSYIKWMRRHGLPFQLVDRSGKTIEVNQLRKPKNNGDQ